MKFFSIAEPIKYEGPESRNPLAFRWYDAKKKVLGKTMEEHLRFAVAYSLLVLGDREIATEVPTIIKALSWRLRHLNPDVKRVREAVETSQPLAPSRPHWESWGPRRQEAI